MATREELAAQITDTPYDDELYVIYGDLLQQHGDPRGELIAIDAAATRAPADFGAWRRRRVEWLAAHPELVPPSDGVELTWHLGFVRRVSVHEQSARLAELAAHPSLAFATELTLELSRLGAEDIATTTASFSLLSRLALGDPDARSWGRDDDTVYDLAVIAPRLEDLVSSVAVAFEHAPRLRRLSLREVDASALARVVRARLPALEKLSLKLQRPRSYRRANLPPVELVEPDHLRELFRAPPPRLATLELIDALPGDEVVAALVGSPLLAQLRVLRLWNADLTDAAARYLTREACGHLELLDLTDPLLDGALAARLSTACDDVRTTNPVLDHVLGRATSKP